MILHNKQKEIVSNNARFKVIRAGRKGGKSALEIENLCYKALVSIKKLPIVQKVFKTGRKVIYIAPTQDQARRIVWEALKTRLAGIGIPNEQQMSMKVPNEDGDMTTIYVGGYENRENYRGLTDVIHITFDEVDTLKNFFVSWREIFRPLFLDTSGTADFIGTPKKESGNLRRLEKEAQNKKDWACFHFTSKDNPHLPINEINEIEEEYKDDRVAYQQEILAEYVDNTGSLIRYDALLDVFSNTIEKYGGKYLIVDIAGQGSDKTIFSFWDGLEEYRREEYSNLNSDAVIIKIKEFASTEMIPFSHIAVDGIGEGAGVAYSNQLSGIIIFKSSFAPIKMDVDPTKVIKSSILMSDYKNLRSQCVFALAEYINAHKIASRVQGDFREKIIEELSLYQETSLGDGKRSVTKKEDIKEVLGRSPDHSDTWTMRMFFVLKGRVVGDRTDIARKLLNQFEKNRYRSENNSTR